MNYKTLTAIVVFFGMFMNAQHVHSQDFFQRTDAFLKQYVEDGQVNYSLLNTHPEPLEQLLYDIDHIALKGRSAEFIKAFYINSYNILVMATIVNKWPVKSPLDIDGMFKEIEHGVALKTLTLDQIEHDILLKPTADPRIHFALVCAANGCPPLLADAYIPDRLNEQLDFAVSNALSKPHILKMDKKNKVLTVTKIIDWYREDFGTNVKSIILFLNNYLQPPLGIDYTLKFNEYDWTVNGY